jgi:hypothetical protein
MLFPYGPIGENLDSIGRTGDRSLQIRKATEKELDAWVEMWKIIIDKEINDRAPKDKTNVPGCETSTPPSD